VAAARRLAVPRARAAAFGSEHRVCL